MLKKLSNITIYVSKLLKYMIIKKNIAIYSTTSDRIIYLQRFDIFRKTLRRFFNNP